MIGQGRVEQSRVGSKGSVCRISLIEIDMPIYDGTLKINGWVCPMCICMQTHNRYTWICMHIYKAMSAQAVYTLIFDSFL